MPRISLWNNNKGKTYDFIDRTLSAHTNAGGVGVLIHRYVGPSTGGGTTAISDVLFLENRGRKYDDTVLESRCIYQPQDTDYDLTQFGVFLSSDVVRIDFHYNDMIRTVGRKLMSGDVLEFPNMRDITIDGQAINKFYVVQDSLYTASGYGPDWMPHFWKIKAKLMPASEEFKEVVANTADNSTAGGEGDFTGIIPAGWSDIFHTDESGRTDPGPAAVASAFDLYCKIGNITDELEKEAMANVKFDPKAMLTNHLYIHTDKNGYPVVQYWHTGDGTPPNGLPLVGIGHSFPDTMVDGDYFLRTDYTPDVLYQKQGSRFMKIESDLLKIWTAYNKVLDTFIDNTNMTVFDDGTIVREKTGLSKAGTSRVDLYSDRLTEIIEKAKIDADLAKKQDGAE